MIDADIDRDGKLSLEEFKNWYSTADSDVVGKPGFKLSSIRDNMSSIHEVKKLTNLGAYDVKDIFNFLTASGGNDGGLTRQKFFRCFNKLIQRTDGRNVADQERTKLILNRLFDVFDRDGNGVIDTAELGAGLSVLCGGSKSDKVKTAFPRN